MKRYTLQISLMLAVFMSPAFTAETKKTLVVGFGMHKPPYVFEKEDTGLEVEIFREAARAAGYEVTSFYGPMERVKAMLIKGQLDAITNTNANENLNVYKSEPFIEYQNYAIALKSRNLDIKTITDLKKYSISSFQRARALLGDEFAKMAEGNPLYHEFADQKLRNIQLYKKRVDVVIADKRNFEYFNTQLDKSMDQHQEITFYKLFKPFSYQAAFRSQEVMKDFNSGLAVIKKNGTYKKLENKYRFPNTFNKKTELEISNYLVRI